MVIATSQCFVKRSVFVLQSMHETYERVESMDAELKAYLDALRQDLMAHTDLRINETHVLIEDLRHDLQGVAEGVLTVNQKLDRYMADTEQRLTRLERRVP